MDNWIEIDKKAIQHNYKVFQSLEPSTQIAPVLKSNAYGHGLSQCYEALKPLKPNWICINYLSEAQQLRDLGFSGRLLLVGPLFEKAGFVLASKLQVDIQLISPEQFEIWSSLESKPKAHIELDTGLHRLGFHEEQLSELAKLSDKSLVVGVGTHFANVEDVQDDVYAQKQFSLFQKNISSLKKAGFAFEVKHASASAPFLLFPDARLDLCRLGISLYGLWPSDQTRLSYLAKYNNAIELQPVLSWKTKIAQIKSVAKGQSIGYGCTFKASHNMKIAVLPIGYNEGFARLIADDSSYVLIRGQRAPLVGRICMNMCMVDVTYIDGIDLNDVVTLIGQDGDEILSAEKVAGWAKTIHYEFLTRLHLGIARKLV